MEHVLLAKCGRRSCCLASVMLWSSALLLCVYWPSFAQQPPDAFTIRSYLSSNYPDGSYPGKCLTHGPAAGTPEPPVFIKDCDGSALQSFIVEDITVQAPGGGVIHKAVLHAGDKCVGTLAGVIAANIPLVIRDCSHALVLKLDGDSMIVDGDHNYVAAVKDGHPANGTPVVLGSRQLSDIEFWDFFAADKTARKPTGAFVEVADWQSLGRALHNATPGTVIEVTGSPFQFGDHRALSLPSDCTGSGLVQIPAGVTIRGDRRGTHFGPLIWFDTAPGNETLFEISGDDVRITGLRLQGPTREKGGKPPLMRGICSQGHVGVMIDHNDLSDWTRAAIDLYRFDSDESKCHAPPELNPQHDVLIADNFIHDNQNQQIGYGVGVGKGAYPLINGNIFLRNYHAIGADPSTRTAYGAWFNVVLSDAPDYGNSIHHDIEHDFDMHGHGDHGVGGFGGNGVEIARNTFLGANRTNVQLRGVSCGLSEVHDNVFRHPQDDTPIQWYNPHFGGDISGGNNPPSWLTLKGNQFGQDPTQKLGVGDFDGDGKDDLFLATGEAWYYSPRGTAEWRFLSAKTETLDRLLFGDFDNDGRTDVFTQHGNDWMVSWGGISPWEKINTSQWRMSDFVIGDFVGDRRADVFFARGDKWFVSDAGRGPFVPYANSSFKKPDLAFGHFDSLKKFGNDEKTDVVGVVNNQWMAVYAQTDHAWKPLRSGPAPTKTMSGLIIADFEGAGNSDIAQAAPWRVSRGGVGPWQPLSSALASGPFVAVGRFDDNPGADILIWDSRSLDIVPSGTATRRLWSRQDMK